MHRVAQLVRERPEATAVPSKFIMMKGEVPGDPAENALPIFPAVG